MKKGLIVVLIMISLLINSISTYALAPLTLGEAKKLAVENARSLQSYKATVEQLRIRASIAKDTYEAKDIYIKYENALNYLIVLEQDIADIQQELLNPALTDEERASLNSKLESKLRMKTTQEMSIAAYKAQFPTALGSDTPVKKAWETAKNLYDDTKISYEQALLQMELAVEKLFFGIYYQQLSLDMLDKASQVQKANREITLISRDLGLATDMDVEKADKAINDTAKGIADLKLTYESAVWKLNDLVGRDVTSPLQIAVPEFTPAPMVKTYEAVLKKYWENDVLIPPKERDLKDLKDDYKDTDDRNERAVLSAEIEKAEIDIIDTKQAINEKIKSLLDGADAKYTAWQNALLSKKEADLLAKFDQIKFELGLIPKIQNMNSELAAKQALINERKAAYDYYTALHEIELAEAGIIELLPPTVSI
jgi:outer membrane protein TolC